MFIHYPTNYKKLKIREGQTKLLSNNKTILEYCFYPKFPYSNIVFTQNFHIPILFFAQNFHIPILFLLKITITYFKHPLPHSILQNYHSKQNKRQVGPLPDACFSILPSSVKFLSHKLERGVNMTWREGSNQAGFSNLP